MRWRAFLIALVAAAVGAIAVSSLTSYQMARSIRADLALGRALDSLRLGAHAADGDTLIDVYRLVDSLLVVRVGELERQARRTQAAGLRPLADRVDQLQLAMEAQARAIQHLRARQSADSLPSPRARR